MPVQISYDGCVAAKLAIVVLSFVAFGFLCELLVLILRYIGIIKIRPKGRRKGEKSESRETVSYDSTMKSTHVVLPRSKRQKRSLAL